MQRLRSPKPRTLKLSSEDFRALFFFQGRPPQQDPEARWNLCLGAVPWAGSPSLLPPSSLRATLVGFEAQEQLSFLPGPTLQGSFLSHHPDLEAGPSWLHS